MTSIVASKRPSCLARLGFSEVLDTRPPLRESFTWWA
jgi:hypothetical protein